MKTKYIYFLLIAALVIVLGLWLWSSSRVEKVSVGIVIVGPEGLSFQLIKDRKLDLAEGLDITVISENSPAEIERKLRDREILVGIFPPISAAKAHEAGKPIKLFAPIFKNPVALIAHSDSSFRSIEDLKGRKIASLAKITSLYTTSEAALQKTLGLSLENDFKLVIATDFGELARLLKNREVDAILAIPVITPIRRLLLSGEATVIQPIEKLWEDVGHTMPFSIVSAWEDWLSANKRTAIKIARALYKANQIIQEDPNIFREYAGFLKLENDAEIKFMETNFPQILYTGFDEDLFSDLTNLLKELENLGFIKELKEGIALKLE